MILIFVDFNKLT